MIAFINTLVTSSLSHTEIHLYRRFAHFPISVAHALGFPVFTSRHRATDYNTETSTSNHYKVFLIFHLQSLWNLGTKNSSALNPPAYDWPVSAFELNEFCHLYSQGTYKHYRKHMSRDHQPPLRDVTTDMENTASSTVECWTVFTVLFPGNALIKSVTLRN
jgi:hypothetical protein